MDQFNNDDLEYVVADYYDEFEDDDLYEDNEPQRNNGFDYLDSDFEDDFEMTKSKTDTSALEAREGKDIQGIPWERLNYTRDKYRETRLKQYKNYENLSLSREELEKECLEVDKGKNFYDFQFNTRLVKSTIVHFQRGNIKQTSIFKGYHLQYMPDILFYRRDGFMPSYGYGCITAMASYLSLYVSF